MFSRNRTDRRPNYGGFVWVQDGTNLGSRLYSFTDGKSHVKPEQNFGFAVAAADGNGDGNADVICGAHRGQTGPARTAPTTGYVRVFSGATGLLLYQLNGEAAGEQFGRFLDAGGDLTGDGIADIGVGARWAALGGYVKAFDGPTGTQVDRQQADADFEWLGSSVAITRGGTSGLPRWPRARMRATRGPRTRAATSGSISTDRLPDRDALFPPK